MASAASGGEAPYDALCICAIDHRALLVQPRQHGCGGVAVGSVGVMKSHADSQVFGESRCREHQT
ncbi:MAG: hypothetical protein ACRDL8_20515, partial [Solirubrobacteraceae bacterium]